MKDPMPVHACPRENSAPRHRQSSGRAPQRSPSCPRPARQSAPDCSSFVGTGSESPDPPQTHGQPEDLAAGPSPTASGRARTPPAYSARRAAPCSTATKESSPGSSAATLRGSPADATHAPAESPPQSTSLRAADPAANVPSQYVCARAALPPQPHKPTLACTHSTAADRPKSTPSLESSCAPQSACESTPPTRATAKSGSSVPCPRATARAANARSRYKATQTDLLHTGQRR